MLGLAIALWPAAGHQRLFQPLAGGDGLLRAFATGLLFGYLPARKAARSTRWWPWPHSDSFGELHAFHPSAYSPQLRLPFLVGLLGCSQQAQNLPPPAA